jgi:hypothetical protein
MSNVSTDADAMRELERPNSTGQRPNEDVPHVDIVTEPENDIAKSEVLEKITVGVAGRQRFQKIFVRQSGSSSGGQTTTTYEPKVDAPRPGRILSVLPTIEEIESRAGTLQFLVVGIVLAEDPKKYSTKASGSSRNRQRETERAARGVLSAERNILRAVVPITQFIGTGSIKYYVACHHLHGLCNLRVISSDAIFYFSEIWDGVREDANTKERRRQLGAACKMHAARDKKPPQRALVQVSESDSTPSNAISITPTVNAANRLLMQYSMYSMSKQPSAIAALKQTLENILPDLLNRPTDDSILGFYDFDTTLDEADAVKAITAVMVRVELLTICISSNMQIDYLPCNAQTQPKTLFRNYMLPSVALVLGVSSLTRVL